ncbi:patatin-like phospholipase [Mucilaginibacter frigoritolerans]|uniref:Patatin-like phospholipase n=1 Tax=Mucilaginibacter frigoritolerans TaxID=652788 RepID=A0A562U6L7_9SPHI|nr:patatin-like phospholipase family protein [Mucilaginibacter frigoritolerans]TWJ01426.1 patatin-like phospholipase [Mucilaginibacter frigoritolerans]
MSATNSLTQPARQAPQQDIDRKLITILPETPFGNMALALSGGGFRAAAFSLGAISYLNRGWVDTEDNTLLKHVTFITSTSGGTLANAYYTSCLFKPGFVFDVFYNNMKNFMDGEGLLEEVCAILNDPKRWDEVGEQTVNLNGKIVKQKVEKTHNLINSFAKAYDKLLFNDPQNPNKGLFDVYFDKTENPHLQTVCFNATELNNGISFRFQTNGDTDSIRTVGNYYLHFNNADVARKLKLGDLAATSSCFPGGFEPMIYPNDYIHPGLTDVNQMLKAIDYKNNNPLTIDTIIEEPFCMVDGGVVDNQGIYSMLMEDTYRADHPPKKQFDLMMVCDVGSYFNTAYKTPPKLNAWWRNLSVDKFKKLLPIGVIVFIISTLLVCLTDHIWRRLGLLFLLSSGIYTILYVLVVVSFNNAMASLQTTFGKTIAKVVGFFFKTPLNNVQQMLATRLNSILMVTSGLFLKQIRRQYYSEFYNMPAYKDRVLSNYIYEFSAQHDATRVANLNTKDVAWWPAVADRLSPSAVMQQMATTATGMGTTLWFEPGNQTMRDAIVACGQFTMCYNLLKRIYRLEVMDDKWKTDPSLQDLKTRLLTDWDKFKQQPGWMA